MLLIYYLGHVYLQYIAEKSLHFDTALNITKKPFETVGINIAFSKNGFRYVLVAIDYFTNWVEASLLKRMCTEEVIRMFFKIIISRHGCPEHLMSDSGSTFISKEVTSLCKCFN
jgi:transposase InsO family protein